MNPSSFSKDLTKVYFIEFLVEKSKKKEAESKVKKPAFGSLKGKIYLSEDFDAPLDELKDYM